MRNRITPGWAFIATLVGLLLTHAHLGAQGRPSPPRTVRLYVFDCGVLKIADPMPLFGLKKEEVAATDFADAAYLIVHPGHSHVGGRAGARRHHRHRPCSPRCATETPEGRDGRNR